MTEGTSLLRRTQGTGQQDRAQEHSSRAVFVPSPAAHMQGDEICVRQVEGATLVKRPSSWPTRVALLMATPQAHFQGPPSMTVTVLRKAQSVLSLSGFRVHI